MNEYLYISDGAAHLINAKRLLAKPTQIGAGELEKRILGCYASEGWLYIASDVLLLDDSVANASHDASLNVILSDLDCDDGAIREALATLFNTFPESRNSIALLKIMRRDIPRSISEGRAFEPKYCELMTCLPMPRRMSISGFGSNIRLLQFLGGITELSHTLLVSICHRQWLESRNEMISLLLKKSWPKLILKTEINRPLINATSEISQVNAGFSDGTCCRQMEAAIDEMFARLTHCDSESEVYVRPQLLDIECYGVCATRGIKNNSPYYIISYDRDLTQESNPPIEKQRLLYIHHDADLAGQGLPSEICRLIAAIREIEDLFDRQPMKIGFLLQGGEVAIVSIQALANSIPADNDNLVREKIHIAEQLFRQVAMTESEGRSDHDAFTSISRWGVKATLSKKPKPLEFSLCQYLNPLAGYGLGSQEAISSSQSRYAMVKIGGSPYMSVGGSAHNTASEFQNPKLVSRLLDAHLKLIESKCSVEGIENLSWFPGVDHWLAKQYGDYLSYSTINAITEELKSIFADHCCRSSVYSAQVDSFEPQFSALLESDIPVLTKASAFFDLSHHYTKKPLNKISRNAFIAVRVLKALFEQEVISPETYSRYIDGLNESSQILSGYAYRVRRGGFSKIDFLEKFGFLRERPFDIVCPVYVKDSLSPLYGSLNNTEPPLECMTAFDETSNFLVSECLNKNGFSFNGSVFDVFVRSAIRDHKHSRLNFDRYLSYGLEYLAEWGEGLGVNRETLSFLTIADVQSMLRGDLPMDRKRIEALVHDRQRDYEVDGKIELPEVIRSIRDFHYHHK